MNLNEEKTREIIWMEILLIVASILIFRSVWLFIDLFAWARSGIGLIMLFIAGLFVSIFALKKIHSGD